MDSACQGQGAVQLAQTIGSNQQDDLAELTRRCIDRIGGERATWETRDVARGISQSGFRTQFVLAHLGGALATRSPGRNPELAVWDAMCRLELRLRRRRAIAAPGRRSQVGLLDLR